MKNDIKQIKKILENPKKKTVAMVAPSFVTEFKYPQFVWQLKKLGFDKVVELTFGAKMINRDYHALLKRSKGLVIASPCPGVVNTIKNNFPKLKGRIAKIDSPMVAMGKICRKHFKGYEIVFISPCDFKKAEAEASKFVDWTIDYDQVRELIKEKKIRRSFRGRAQFDKFYNDYTKIYPLSGGLSETAHLKGILKRDEIKVVDGINNVMESLKNPDPKVKFLDCLFCEGGCIGGPHTNKKLSIRKKHKKVMKYLCRSKKEDIPEDRKGLLKKAKGIKFTN